MVITDECTDGGNKGFRGDGGNKNKVLIEQIAGTASGRGMSTGTRHANIASTHIRNGVPMNEMCSSVHECFERVSKLCAPFFLPTLHGFLAPKKTIPNIYARPSSPASQVPITRQHHVSITTSLTDNKHLQFTL